MTPKKSDDILWYHSLLDFSIAETIVGSVVILDIIEWLLNKNKIKHFKN